MTGGVPGEIQGTISTIDVSGGLQGVDVCGAIPAQVIESVRGMSIKTAQPFTYYDTPDSIGCTYDFGKGSDGEAFFGYVGLMPAHYFDEQPMYLDEAVSGLGDEAFFNNGADARQLWVKTGDIAMVVAFGDVPQEEACRNLAEAVLAAIQQ